MSRSFLHMCMFLLQWALLTHYISIAGARCRRMRRRLCASVLCPPINVCSLPMAKVAAMHCSEVRSTHDQNVIQRHAKVSDRRLHRSYTLPRRRSQHLVIRLRMRHPRGFVCPAPLSTQSKRCRCRHESIALEHTGVASCWSNVTTRSVETEVPSATAPSHLAVQDNSPTMTCSKFVWPS